MMVTFRSGGPSFLTSVLGAVATRDRGQNVARRYRLEVTPVILSQYRLRIAVSPCSFILS